MGEEATCVRQKYLEALEQGNFAALPPGAIARGFLRNYASFLGLDPIANLRLYGQESGNKGIEVPQGSISPTLSGRLSPARSDIDGGPAP